MCSIAFGTEPVPDAGVLPSPKSSDQDLSGMLSGSLLPDPSKKMSSGVVPEVAVGTRLATGGWLTFAWIVTVACGDVASVLWAPWLSVTVSVAVLVPEVV